jgi:hypothetical protein
MVEINIEVLRSVRSMKEDKAQQIIDQTTKAILNWKMLIDVKHGNKKITVEVPTDLGEDPLIIVLMNKEMKTVAALAYDQKEKQFPQQEEDEEDEKSSRPSKEKATK